VLQTSFFTLHLYVYVTITLVFMVQF